MRENSDEAALRIQVRFPAFADPAAAPAPIDGTAARTVLQALQARYNTEQAALAALQQRALDHAAARSRRAGFWRGLLKARSN